MYCKGKYLQISHFVNFHPVAITVLCFSDVIADLLLFPCSSRWLMHNPGFGVMNLKLIK